MKNHSSWLDNATRHLVSVATILFSIGSAHAVVLERLDASVNAQIILLSDLSKFRATLPLRAQLDPLFAGTSIAAKGAAARDEEIREFLISEKIISQQFPVQDSEVEQEINSIQASNRIDRASLKSALKQQGFSFDDYFELIRASVSKRSLIDREIRTRVVISEDDVKNYFYNHYSKNSAVPSAYTTQMITISPSDYKSPAAAKEVAQRALGRIRAGEKFEEVAKSVEVGKETVDTSTLTEDQMSPRIKAEIKNLKIGQVSGLLGSESTGFFILKLVDIKSAEGERLENMKEQIRSQLAAAEYQHQIQLWQERQKQSAFVHRHGDPAIRSFNPVK